jgi:hypothetical protein
MGMKMRLLIVSVALLALGACNRLQQEASAPANGCARSVTHEVSFTDSAAPDVFTANAEGPTCDQAIVSLTLRAADGTPLMTTSDIYLNIRFGGGRPPDAEPTTPAQMDEFLTGWANVSELKSGTLPAWAPGASGPDGDGMSYSSDFGQEAYELMRARDATMLCYAAGMESSSCIVVDPATNTPIKLVTFGP